MNIQNATTLFFDLDGTLVDSVPDFAVAINKTLQDLTRQTFDEKTIRQWVGNGATSLVKRALSGSKVIDLSIDEALVKDASAIFFNHYQQALSLKSTLYDGVEQGLTQLKDAGYRLVIITNKAEQFIQPILTGLGIGNLFELHIGGDSLAQNKPHPAQLNFALAQLSVSAEECVMIGDSKADILAAKAAGIQCAAFTYGYNDGEDLTQYQPEYCFHAFRDLVSALQ